LWRSPEKRTGKKALGYSPFRTFFPKKSYLCTCAGLVEAGLEGAQSEYGRASEQYLCADKFFE
jgi:hypothetical protein